MIPIDFAGPAPTGPAFSLSCEERRAHATERAPPKTFMLAAPSPVLVAQDTQRACNQFAGVGTPSRKARRVFPRTQDRSLYGAAFAHTVTRGLVVAPLGHVTVRSLTKVTALLRGPQYATISTSSALHSALHVAAWQLERMTRTALSPAAEASGQGGPGGPCSP